MEKLVMEVLKIIGGILFFIYGLPFLIILVCDTCTWISSKISGTKSNNKCNYYTNILNESKAFMYSRR